MKPRVAFIRGTSLNPFEGQNIRPLQSRYDVVAVGAVHGSHDAARLGLPVKRLHSLSSITRLMPGPLRYGANMVAARVGHHESLYGLPRFLRSFDIAHTAEVGNGYTQQALRARTRNPNLRVVVTVWENIASNGLGMGRLRAIDWRTRRQVAREADAFIAISTRARDALLLDGVDEARVHVIPMGVDPRRFAPESQDPRMRAQLGIPRDAAVILFVGRLSWSKGPQDLVHALYLVRRDSRVGGLDPHILFVGDGPERKTLDVLSRRLGLRACCRFLRNVPYPRMGEVYRCADVFSLPSIPVRGWQEQWGMAIVEAMASGLPIVTTLSGSIPEVVGGAAVTVQPADPQGLANALTDLLASPSDRASLGATARARALELFTVDRVSREYEALYSSLL